MKSLFRSSTRSQPSRGQLMSKEPVITTENNSQDVDTNLPSQAPRRPAMKRSSGKQLGIDFSNCCEDDITDSERITDVGGYLTDTDTSCDSGSPPHDPNISVSCGNGLIDTTVSNAKDILSSSTNDSNDNQTINEVGGSHQRIVPSDATVAKEFGISRVSSLKSMLQKREEQLASAVLKARLVYFVQRDDIFSEAISGLLVGQQKVRKFIKYNTFERHITVVPDEYEMVEINMDNVFNNYCDRGKLLEFELEAAAALPSQFIASNCTSNSASSICCTANSSAAVLPDATTTATTTSVAAAELVCYTARDDITVTTLVGLSAGEGRLRRFIDYNKFATEVIEVPANYEQRHLDPHMSARFYFGSRSGKESFEAVYDDTGNKHMVSQRRLSSVLLDHQQQQREQQQQIAAELLDDVQQQLKKRCVKEEDEEAEDAVVEEEVVAVADDLSNLLDISKTDSTNSSTCSRTNRSSVAAPAVHYRRKADDAIEQSVLNAAAAASFPRK